MLLVDLLKEYEYDVQVRNYSERTIKTYYNSTLKFFNYCKNEFDVEELEDVLLMYLKKHISYLQGLGRSEVYINLQSAFENLSLNSNDVLQFIIKAMYSN